MLGETALLPHGTIWTRTKRPAASRCCEEQHKSLTSVVGKLQVVVMEGQEILDGRDAARARGELPHAVVLAGQQLHVVICQEKREKGLSWEGWWWC